MYYIPNKRKQISHNNGTKKINNPENKPTQFTHFVLYHLVWNLLLYRFLFTPLYSNQTVKNQRREKALQQKKTVWIITCEIVLTKKYQKIYIKKPQNMYDAIHKQHKSLVSYKRLGDVHEEKRG